MDKISYALGVNLGKNLQGNGIKNLNYKRLAKGIEDAMEDQSLEISLQDVQAIINKYITELEDEIQTSAKSEGKAFLSDNAQRKEVIVLPSGLQYEILTQGNGDLPKSSDKVTVHYHGTLINGTVFDSSVKRGEPATFGVTQVIQGWVEALQLMPKGSKWKLYIPSELAYGSQGAGKMIAPHSTLIFEVELLDIIK